MEQKKLEVAITTIELMLMSMAQALTTMNDEALNDWHERCKKEAHRLCNAGGEEDASSK